MWFRCVNARMHTLNNTTDHAQLTRQFRETVLSTRDIQEEESFLNQESERKEEKKKMLIRSEDRTLKSRNNQRNSSG